MWKGVKLYYEVIYEDGSHSIAQYDDDDEALSATQAHHDRALAGESALAGVEVPAVRVVKVLAYEDPPGQLLSAHALPQDQLEAELPALIANSTQDGVVDLGVLTAHIRDLSNPFKAESAPHESKYKAEEVKELSLPWQ